MVGPDGQPLKVVRVQDTSSEAWAGVAAVDRGQGDKPPAWHATVLLAAGDLAALLLFTAVGRASHGESLEAAQTLGTALPFVVGWFGAASLLGGYGPEARGAAPGPAAAAAAKCWAAGVPAGIVLRSLGRGYVPAVPFMVVTMAVTGVLLVGWRAARAAAAPQPPQLSGAQRAAQRTNKRGNPFEFLELLTSLVRRW